MTLAARWLSALRELNPQLHIDDMNGDQAHVLIDGYFDLNVVLAQALAPGDDLVERAGKYPEILMGYSQGDMGGVMALISRQALHESADTITALLARLSALTAERDLYILFNKATNEENYRYQERARDAEREAATLRDRLARMEEALRQLKDNAKGPWVPSSVVGAIVDAALTDGGSNGSSTV